RTRCSRTVPWAILTSPGSGCLEGREGGRSGFDDLLEAAVDQALAVERHRIDVRLQAWVRHHLLHAFVAQLARWPGNPREHDGLVGLAFHGHRKRRHLAIGHVLAPAFDDLERTVLLEDDRGC